MTARIIATIDRTSLSLADLTLGEGTIYRLGPAPGSAPGTPWLTAGLSDYRRNTPTPQANVPGRQVTDWVLDTITSGATLTIGDGETPLADVIAAFTVLIAAVRQDPWWRFTVTYDTVTIADWSCEPAAIQPDYTKLLLSGFLPVTLTMPRQPIPVSGPF